MAARCGLCLKTTANKKQSLHLVTSDAETKLQFGYYSLHQIDLNRSLFNTKVHQKCYKKYHDRWYNQSIRNTKVTNVSSNFEHEVMSINDENNAPDEICSPDVCNIDNNDDNNDGDADDDETFDSFCPKTTVSNQSISQKNKSAFMDISNVDYSPRSTTNYSRTDQIFSTEELLVHDINDENIDICSNSVLQNNTDCRYNDIFSEKEKVINTL
jgi:hypothetical protein